MNKSELEKRIVELEKLIEQKDSVIRSLEATTYPIQYIPQPHYDPINPFTISTNPFYYDNVTCQTFR